jgi:hypothetical protein
MGSEMELTGAAHGIVDYVFATVFLALLVALWRHTVSQQKAAAAAAERASKVAEAALTEAAKTARDERLLERREADGRQALLIAELAAARKDYAEQLEKRDERFADLLRSVTREFADSTRSINERVMNAVISLQAMTDTLGRRVGRRDGG